MKDIALFACELDDEEMPPSKKELRAQPANRIVNRTIREQSQLIFVVGVILLVSVLYLFPTRSSTDVTQGSSYNYTYPLTRPIKTDSLHTFRIGIIADLDTDSKSENEKSTYYSYFKQGYLNYNPKTMSVHVTWDEKEPMKLKNTFALKGRGMELSELVTFDGKLLTVEDRTGLVYEIINNRVVPWLLLMDGDGKKDKGFKSEWATVKDEILYVGSIGKEWTTASGEFVNNDPQYVKAITTKGEVSHINWVEQYKRLREVLGIYWPGYMIHESGVWSHKHQRWFFLPRRCSNESYDESLDEHRGCSVVISANADMYEIHVVQIKNLYPTRGFSSFKFIPTSDDYVIAALRTEELEGNTSSYITAFTIDGDILLDDTYVDNVKYEGFEFI